MTSSAAPGPADPVFPAYTMAERAADRVVHVTGLAAALVAVPWLLGRVVPAAPVREIVAVSVYCAGLIGMLSASALYNCVRPGSVKAALRRVDHSMIFVMIAGSYMPYAVCVLPARLGQPLCAVVWSIAAAGIALKLAARRAHELVFLSLYLGMGWLVLAVARPLFALLPRQVGLLLLAGGLVYSLGALIHVSRRIRFHNAIWHAMVAVAAALHFVAVCQLIALPFAG